LSDTKNLRKKEGPYRFIKTAISSVQGTVSVQRSLPAVVYTQQYNPTNRPKVIITGYWLLVLVLVWGMMPLLVQAQDATPTAAANEGASTNDSPIPRVHTVAEGENLTYIATLYNVTVPELQAINNLSEDSLLFLGQSLIIPGGTGEAVATVYTVKLGDTLPGVAARFNTTLPQLAAANRLIQPDYNLTVGQSLAVVSRTGSGLPQDISGQPHLVDSGESLLLVAARYRVSPAVLANLNGINRQDYLFPGQRLRIPAATTYRFLPDAWVDVAIRPLSLVAGSTFSIYVENLQSGLPTGQFAGQTLQFIPQGDGFVALIGLDAFTPPGLYTLTLSGSGSRPWRPFQQAIPISSGNYGEQYITIPEELSVLLDPSIRQNEDAFLDNIYTRFSAEPLWEGLFQYPVTSTIFTAEYGAARSYNGGPFEIFHTGIDFAGTIGTPILAPANGVVVFSDVLELRGNTVILDHGLGVMTAYFHLAETAVSMGDSVTQGQLIGLGGDTGLSTGPHLHWDVRVMGQAVNGRQWTEIAFP